MLDKKYDFKLIEPEIQKLWQEKEIFKFSQSNSGEVYSIDTPPPTVSGKLHIGHIFSYTQAEMIARYKKLRGFNVYYPFGFDDNGLPTERLVEKEQGILAKSMQRSEFAKLCKETVKKYEDSFRALWDSLGFSTDWSLGYETINPLAQRISQKSFLELAKNGNAYQKEKPVLWCAVCQTSIAQAELEIKEIPSSFNRINFYVGNDKIEVATTRPEFLFGCAALMLNPNDKRAKKYKNKTAKVPLYGFEVPIILDEKVDLEKGSGAVMCCTFGDTTDLEWFEKHSLPYKKVIEADGRIAAEVPFIGGMKIKEARATIIQRLTENGDFLGADEIIHKVSVHERCGTGVEILPSKQWYIDILNHKEQYLRAADEINWYPAHMKNRYTVWVENLKWDWCISRQRFFGVPFPVWYCKKCATPIFADQKDLPVNPLEDKPKQKCACGCDEFVADGDVMDTWATSSVTPLINARWKESDSKDFLFPMTMRTQAHEIIRTWAFYTIVKSIYHCGQIPWRDIMICGFVLAKKGDKEKISKSKGQAAILEPKQLIEKYGADGVRYWAASNRLGTDTFYSEDEISQSGRFLTKLWNASKFSLMQLEGYVPVQPKVLLAQDANLLDRFNKMQKAFCSYMDEYEAGLAKHELDAFFWGDYCDYYLELAKERLYQPQKHGEQNRLSGQYTIYNTLLGMLKLYSIFTPYISEKIYREYFQAFEKIESVATHKICDFELAKSIQGYDDALKEIIGTVRKAKTENGFSMKEPISTLKIEVASSLIDAFEQTKNDIAACATAETVTICAGSQTKIDIVFAQQPNK